MAEYTTNLNLFKPGTDPNLEIETTLRDNFQNIDDKLGNALKDKNQVVWATLGARLDDYQTKIDDARSDIDRMSASGSSSNIFQSFNVISKRGVSVCPENTLVGYRRAKDWGYWGILADCQITSDAKWVMFRELTVNNLTNGTGTVTAMTLSQLKALDCGTKFNSFYSLERIPTLEEFLQLTLANSIVPVIFLPNAQADLQIQNFVDILKQYNALNRVVIVSPQYDNLTKIRDLTKVPVLGLYTNVVSDTIVTQVDDLDNAFAMLTDDVCNSTNLKKFFDLGIQVIAYLNTDKPSKVYSMQNLGVSGVVTSTVLTKGA